MNTATIIGGAPTTGGEAFYQALIQEGELLIAADSGAELCRSAGRVPDILVGDLDSVSPEALAWAQREGARVVRAPIDKDVTDLDLALSEARAKAVDRAIVSAAWGQRIDHTLAAIGSVAAETCLAVEIVDPGLAGWILRPESTSSITLEPRGAWVSLFALGPPATVTTHGMRYELSSETLVPLSSRGLSNVIDSDEATVQVAEGVLLVLSSPDDRIHLASRTSGG